MLETLAEGPKPEPREGHEAYARWHTTGSTSSVQWFTRRRSTARVRPVRDARGGS